MGSRRRAVAVCVCLDRGFPCENYRESDRLIRTVPVPAVQREGCFTGKARQERRGVPDELSEEDFCI